MPHRCGDNTSAICGKASSRQCSGCAVVPAFEALFHCKNRRQLARSEFEYAWASLPTTHQSIAALARHTVRCPCATRIRRPVWAQPGRRSKVDDKVQALEGYNL